MTTPAVGAPARLLADVLAALFEHDRELAPNDVASSAPMSARQPCA